MRSHLGLPRSAGYRDRRTGALGSVVVGALSRRERPATCHRRHEAEGERFTYSQHDQVKLFGSVDFSHKSAVDRFFGEVPTLSASIHVAGGFAMAPVAKAGKVIRRACST